MLPCSAVLTLWFKTQEKEMGQPTQYTSLWSCCKGMGRDSAAQIRKAVPLLSGWCWMRIAKHKPEYLLLLLDKNFLIIGLSHYLEKICFKIDISVYFGISLTLSASFRPLKKNQKNNHHQNPQVWNSPLVKSQSKGECLYVFAVLRIKSALFMALPVPVQRHTRTQEKASAGKIPCYLLPQLCSEGNATFQWLRMLWNIQQL